MAIWKRGDSMLQPSRAYHQLGTAFSGLGADENRLAVFGGDTSILCRSALHEIRPSSGMAGRSCRIISAFKWAWMPDSLAYRDLPSAWPEAC